MSKDHVSILNLSYGSYVSLDDYLELQRDNHRLKSDIDIISKNLEDIRKLNVRNSRQRIANNNLHKKIKELKEEVEELSMLQGILCNRKYIAKFNSQFSYEYNKANGTKDVYVFPDAEEVYRRYYVYHDRIERLIQSISEEKANIQDYRSLVKYIERELKDIVKSQRYKGE